MKTFEIKRQFVHRGRSGNAFGEIGAVALTVNGDPTMSLNGVTVPRESVFGIIRYGLGQYLQDSYAGADNADEARKRFKAKLQTILDGTMGERGSAEDDPLAVYRRAIIRTAIKGKPAGADYKNADDKTKFIDSYFAKLPEEKQAAVLKQAAVDMKEHQAQIARARALDI